MPTRTRPARNKRGAAAPPRPNLLLLGAIAVVILAGLAALILTLVSDDGEESAADFDTAAATVAGTALVPLPDGGEDPAVGQPSPVITGLGRDGATLVAPDAGRATVLLFLAHWCPHCQAEVPVVRDWVADGNLPDDVDLVGVATATRSNRPNYPPSAWLENEDWDVPTIADAGGEAAVAYGLSAFPYWVAVDATGKVVERRTGELTPDQISELVASAAG